MQGIFRGKFRMRQINYLHPIRQFFFQHATQHGLAAAHLTDNLDHALAT